MTERDEAAPHPTYIVVIATYQGLHEIVQARETNDDTRLVTNYYIRRDGARTGIADYNTEVAGSIVKTEFDWWEPDRIITIAVEDWPPPHNNPRWTQEQVKALGFLWGELAHYYPHTPLVNLPESCVAAGDGHLPVGWPHLEAVKVREAYLRAHPLAPVERDK
jgi:hypothetical protein